MSKVGQINYLIGQGKHPANNSYGYTFDINKLLEIKDLGVVLKFQKNYIKWRWKKIG